MGPITLFYTRHKKGRTEPHLAPVSKMAGCEDRHAITTCAGNLHPFWVSLYFLICIRDGCLHHVHFAPRVWRCPREQAKPLTFRIASMLAAMPFHPVALFKTERSPRFATRVHAVMLKQPDWRFLYVGRVGILCGEPNRFVAHLSLRSRIASISAILCLIALTAS